MQTECSIKDLPPHFPSLFSSEGCQVSSGGQCFHHFLGALFMRSACCWGGAGGGLAHSTDLESTRNHETRMCGTASLQGHRLSLGVEEKVCAGRLTAATDLEAPSQRARLPSPLFSQEGQPLESRLRGCSMGSLAPVVLNPGRKGAGCGRAHRATRLLPRLAPALSEGHATLAPVRHSRLSLNVSI